MPRLTPGTYEVEVTDAFTTESQSGTLGIAFAFKDDQGNTIDHVIWITTKTSERALETLDTLGFGQEQLDGVESLDRIKEFTRGNRVSIVVEDEEYKGTVTAKVKWINKVGGRKVAGVQTKAALFALLKGQPVPVVSAPRTQAVPRQTEIPPNTPISDDDVPF